MGTTSVNSKIKEISMEDYPHTQMINLTAKELSNRREAILSLLGLTWKEFVLKDMLEGLEEQELEYRSELNAIDFLLGDNSGDN